MIQELNLEMERAMSTSHSKRKVVKEKERLGVEKSNEFSKFINERSLEIIQRNNAEKTAYEEVIHRMKESTKKVLEDLHNSHTVGIEEAKAKQAIQQDNPTTTIES